jgi:hypothetical protein
MARDLLAIPISTVASESAFSLGGRILDDFRSSLTSTMVEKLICASDWIRSEYVSVEEDTEQLVKLEEGKSICYFIPIHYFLFYIFVLLNCCFFCFAELGGLTISSSKDKEKESTQDT